LAQNFHIDSSGHDSGDSVEMKDRLKAKKAKKAAKKKTAKKKKK
jgi:hypothetical protein